MSEPPRSVSSMLLLERGSPPRQHFEMDVIYTMRRQLAQEAKSA